MIHEKIGKRGLYRPTLTLSGNPVGRPPYLTVYQLTNGYYAIGDNFPTVDIENELIALQNILNEAIDD